MASSRERILDSFEDILIRDGERAATMENVAAAADVSKGGLLYHFPSKESLVDGLGERLDSLSARDLESMAADPEGPARYYVRTSMYENSPLDRALVAMARLAQQGHPKAQASFSLIQELWLTALEEQLGSRSVARAVKLMGDGLYYDAAFFAGVGAGRLTASELQDVLKMVDLVVREGRRVAGHG
ncbi:AcrR family transcriptional regulator [Arthrobacter sp. V4I6]|uniref:TetR/AcrR family transcriptional regulator n=1 Tax=unclassified Arthrobacter TaxID=235627 RepID=UPI0027843D6C|nr:MULTISPECIES: TetR/AcrR family transcriptional regulator [unclassified Arthrobacter]MDQ0819371.1 AcrR family transcriptional regulator [Arthrobacter sp. V1I7]MDQ0853555.1 AcrR family transcriptional regulator [Arthrobacter sp. V4I6]